MVSKMVAQLKTLSRCCWGPSLYRIHGQSPRYGRLYQPNTLEFASDKIMKTISLCWSLTFWLSPVVLTVLYRRGYFSLEGVGSLIKLSFTLGVIYSGAFLSRGIGRFSNREYTQFLDVLDLASRVPCRESQKKLCLYDSDMWSWPAIYKSHTPSSQILLEKAQQQRSLWQQIAYMPRRLIGYMMMHTFGRGLIYPGSTFIMNSMLSGALLESRAILIEQKKALRAKVITADGNYIDTVFLDKRESETSPNGNILVLVCEGNAGFYEIGCMETPTSAGYSVLGWNRPGFGQSSGKPDTEAEHNAADAMMQYAINLLGFTPENIIVFAWSIGGYDAAYLAANYPDIRALILDATFDTIIPLAIAQMPQFASSLVENAINDYLDLHVAALVKKYDGPVLLIRRSQDEMITVGLGADLKTNRGNYLLIEILTHRYPNLTTGSGIALLHEYIGKPRSMQKLMLEMYGVEPEMCLSSLQSYATSYSSNFPLRIGEDMDETQRNQLLLYLAFNYMEDFESNHCTPLPQEHFHEPWRLVPS